jgi:2-polyprenyl-3-methyl-5-hydroxy-6-metoxy-1,4-benzoquinol methylase
MNCLLCKNDGLKKIYAHAPGRALFRCRQCGLVQTFPMPSVSELDAFYQHYDVMGEREPYYQKLWGAGAADSPEGMEIKTRFLWAEKICKKFGKTLDVGSGPGLFLKLAKAAGAAAFGCELNARAAKESAATTGVTVFSGDIGTVTEKDFDVVCLWDVLEHVSDQSNLLASAAQRLKKDGWLFVETPDEAALLDRLVLCLAGAGIKFPAATFYGLHHLVLFRKKTLTRLLEDNGFKVVIIAGAATDPGRVFRGNGFKDKIMRVALRVVFFAARLIGRQNKMLVAARKTG